MKLSKIGVWAGMDAFTAAEAAAFAKRVEAWGYGALWFPEAVGRNSLVHAAWLLANTTTLVIATGIVNIYARDWVAASSAQKALNEQSGGRFLLGLGVSHSPLVEGFRGQHYGKPVATMRAYLAGMKDARYVAPPPPDPPKTVIAALGPRMLALAAEQADGAHPYNVTAEHTAEVRTILGPGKLLCPEQMILAETDPVKARSKRGRASRITCRFRTTSTIGSVSASPTRILPMAVPTASSMPSSPGATMRRSGRVSRPIGMPALTMSASRRWAASARRFPSPTKTS
jgi:probable F420-dependent oxidoreductase